MFVEKVFNFFPVVAKLPFVFLAVNIQEAILCIKTFLDSNYAFCWKGWMDLKKTLPQLFLTIKSF